MKTEMAFGKRISFRFFLILKASHFCSGSIFFSFKFHYICLIQEFEMTKESVYIIVNFSQNRRTKSIFEEETKIDIESTMALLGMAVEMYHVLIQRSTFFLFEMKEKLTLSKNNPFVW